MTKNDSYDKEWKNSRSGAWAGRGFSYQHLFSCLVLLKQWAGLLPSGALVPEGLDDCVIELADAEVWIQIKSKKDKSFSSSQVAGYFSKIEKKASKIITEKSIFKVVALEQPCTGTPVKTVEHVFDESRDNIVVCSSPGNDAIELILDQLNEVGIIADQILSDLYRLISTASEQNADLAFDDRKRISTSEVQRRIDELLEAIDSSAIDRAVLDGKIESVDFLSTISDKGFYQGTKTMPGHVASGLTCDRPIEVEAVVNALKQRSAACITGPSGSGKSALLWMSTFALSSEFRWYQISKIATASDATDIVRFVRSRRPSKDSPIGIAFDELNSVSSSLWDVLIDSLRALDFVYILGSVRKEDSFLLSNHSEIEFVDVVLDDELAKQLWEKLKKQELTSWTHWREPFEKSEGLLLEYVHILTKGDRLASIINDQVQLRIEEERGDELAIIRCSSAASSLGGELNAQILIDILGIGREKAAKAMLRLIDEHLVQESKPGVIGGMHALRSDALNDAAHDDVLHKTDQSLWLSLKAVTPETLPALIRNILYASEQENEEPIFKELSKLLMESESHEVFTSILTGLGLATLERHIDLFKSLLERHGLDKAHWSLAAMFSDVSIPIPELEGNEQWALMKKAVLEFREVVKPDLRGYCLDLLPSDYIAPTCSALGDLNHFFSSLAPICGGDSLEVDFELCDEIKKEPDLESLTQALATARVLGVEVAEKVSNMFGGEFALLAMFKEQTPWVTVPTIENDPVNGRTVRSNYFHISEEHQKNINEIICGICESTLAYSVHSNAAASDALTPSGDLVRYGDHELFSKNIRRENLPSRSRVAWNVAFNQILLSRMESQNLTLYVEKMSGLIRLADKVLIKFSERWIRGKSNATDTKLVTQINQIINEVSKLVYSEPHKLSTDLTAPSTKRASEDSLGGLLNGITANLFRRLPKVLNDEAPKSLAAFSLSLSEQAIEYTNSSLWRSTSTPPIAELNSIGVRLREISEILNEIANDTSAKEIRSLIKYANKAKLSNSLKSSSMRCRTKANSRLLRRIRLVENAVLEKGWTGRCVRRPRDDDGGMYWPAEEIALLVEINSFEEAEDYLIDTLRICKKYFKHDWIYRIVPVINNKAIAELAFLPSDSIMVIPDADFVSEWASLIETPLFESDVYTVFDEALKCCTITSSIVACRDIDQLHLEEAKLLNDAFDTVEENIVKLTEFTKNRDSDHLHLALEYIEKCRDKIVEEYKYKREGKVAPDLLCMVGHEALTGNNSPAVEELSLVKVLVIQGECLA